jgi:competence protein ComEC
MGTVALAGMSSGSQARGIRALAVAVIVLMLVDPWLARSAGFILSTLATAAIVVLSGPWTRLLSRWLPTIVAEAVAVPTAAQLVCTPVVAMLSGQVSLVGVVANMVAAPAVGPATVMSLLAGVVATADVTLGQLIGRLAEIPLGWIVLVAQHGAGLTGATVQWSAGPLPMIGLAGACLLGIAAMPFVLRRWWTTAIVTLAMVVVILHPIGRLGWPPSRWVMVMCNVGQGDGLVLNAGAGSAVVVDTGPDPVAMNRCLDELGVERVALVILTHFHADHVDGLAGVLEGRAVGRIEVTPYDVPVGRYRSVLTEAADTSVPVTVAVLGERRRIGQLSWTVLGPTPATDGSESAAESADATDEGSGPNNASIVMLLRVQGIRILLTGDAEPEEQDALLRAPWALRADVLKEPHHGSSNIDPQFLAASHARVSLISVGADNTYGHPAPETLRWLDQLGMAVYRTDEDGAVAVVVDHGDLGIVRQR